MGFALHLVLGMLHPALSGLHLSGDGELVVFLWQPLAVLFDDTADGNPPDNRRGNRQAFQHGDAPLSWGR